MFEAGRFSGGARLLNFGFKVRRRRVAPREPGLARSGAQALCGAQAPAQRWRRPPLGVHSGWLVLQGPGVSCCWPVAGGLLCRHAGKPSQTTTTTGACTCARMPWPPHPAQGVVFAAIGFLAGIAGTAISNGLIALRKQLDPSFKTVVRHARVRVAGRHLLACSLAARLPRRTHAPP